MIFELNSLHAKEKITLPLREEKNHFSDSIRQTLIQLQGDDSVPASKCSAVIRTVSKHLFSTDFHEKDLPCMQMALNVADEGHVLTKFQAVERMLEAENFTLHSDRMSRNGQKIIGHQVSLDNGETLSLGFMTVATEDAATLLDVAVHLLEEIQQVYCFEKSEEEKSLIFSSLLSKLTMTDRAAVMKCYDKKLKEFLKSQLGQDATLHFLHCNTHCSLGFSWACDIALKTIEDNTVLGRDKDPRFQRFKKTETATARVIRMTSDITGPRGDDKNGCRADWLAFCEEQGK